VDQVSVRQAVATLRLPQNDDLRLRVNDLELQSGRVVSLGRITMSAGLEQPGDPAPIQLYAAEGASGDSFAAAASFQFSGIDLAQFNPARSISTCRFATWKPSRWKVPLCR
jgi:hypothetical protein